MLLVNGSWSYADEHQFLIGVGDQLAIEVYNEPDLAVRVRVDSTGLINFPLLGSVAVLGSTPKQLAKSLENRYLDGYLVSPLVSVLVEEYRPFYIRGEVRSPGVYDFSLGMTLDRAIAVAGGLKDRASRSGWLIIRGMDKIEMRAEKDTKILPGDVITIKASLF
jgi:polysaccharide export outer membrane protein